jgi:hypothetical protein
LKTFRRIGFALLAAWAKIRFPLRKPAMLSREEFIFTIGYDGPAAVVDSQAKRRYGSLSTKELAEKGLFRAAYSSAVWSNDPKEIDALVEIYNRISGSSLTSASSLDRLFGVFPIKVNRSIAL